MLRNEFVTEMQKKLDGVSKKACNEFVDAFTATIAETLAKGDEVKFVNFGTFKMRKIAAHEGINPETKEKIKIDTVYAPMFKISRGFREKITG